MTVREARINTGYTQVQVGEILGMPICWAAQNFTCPTYSNIERGYTQMTAAMYLRLCELYHVKPGEMEPPCTDLQIKCRRVNPRTNLIRSPKGKPTTKEVRKCRE